HAGLRAHACSTGTRRKGDSVVLERGRCARSFALLLIAVLLAGCGDEPRLGAPSEAPEVADMWRARIEQAAAAGYLSEFERSVLADYWVTDEEYAHSRAHIPECMETAGFNSVIDNSRGTVATSAIPGFWDG